MNWDYEITARALKQLRKLGHEPTRRILDYLDKRIVGSKDPRKLGKSLKGELGEFWRFRVDDYRILCEIKNKELVVLGSGSVNAVTRAGLRLPRRISPA